MWFVREWLNYCLVQLVGMASSRQNWHYVVKDFSRWGIRFNTLYAMAVRYLPSSEMHVRPINHNFFLCWCMKQENIWALMRRRRRIPLQHFDTDSRSSFSFLPNLDSIHTQSHKKMFANLSPSCTHQCPSLTTPQRNVDISSLAKGTTIWATS